MHESLGKEERSRRAAEAALAKRSQEVNRLQDEVAAYKVGAQLKTVTRALYMHLTLVLVRRVRGDYQRQQTNGTRISYLPTTT